MTVDETGERRRRPSRPAIGDVDLAKVVAAVLTSRGVVIGGYAPEFLVGLVAGALAREGAPTVDALADRIATDPACAGRFLSSLWIGTTSLFRDPIAFHAVRRDVVPNLRAGGHARIWIAGCSTGEEVYSLAIVLRDENLLERCRIYATDVNAGALDVARRGTYPAAALREGIPRYHASGGRGSLCEIYAAERGRVTFDPSLRANVVFAVHDLGIDGRFQEFDLVLCRNVMIWFGSAMRDKTLELLRASLAPGASLVLGRRETPRDSPVGEAFERVTAGASLWRLPLGSKGSSDTEPGRLDLAARQATTRTDRGNPDTSTRAAASDEGEPSRPLSARSLEPDLAST